MLPSPVVHPDLATPAALAAADEQRTGAWVQVALMKIERLLNPQPGAPEHDDQPADPGAAQTVPGDAHTATISSTRGGSAG